jgi:hypothetical protein
MMMICKADFKTNKKSWNKKYWKLKLLPKAKWMLFTNLINNLSQKVKVRFQNKKFNKISKWLLDKLQKLSKDLKLLKLEVPLAQKYFKNRIYLSHLLHLNRCGMKEDQQFLKDLIYIQTYNRSWSTINRWKSLFRMKKGF